MQPELRSLRKLIADVPSAVLHCLAMGILRISAPPLQPMTLSWFASAPRRPLSPLPRSLFLLVSAEEVWLALTLLGNVDCFICLALYLFARFSLWSHLVGSSVLRVEDVALAASTFLFARNNFRFEDATHSFATPIPQRGF